MEQAKIFTTHDLLNVLDLKEYDEVIILDRKFRVRDLSSDKSTSEVRLYLLDDDNTETNTFLNLTSLINRSYIVIKVI